MHAIRRLPFFFDLYTEGFLKIRQVQFPLKKTSALPKRKHVSAIYFGTRNVPLVHLCHMLQRFLLKPPSPCQAYVLDSVAAWIGIASLDAYKARTLAIARGDLMPKKDDPKIWFRSTESFARVLTEKNRALLTTIAQQQPSSLEELGELTGRAPSNLSRTLKTMAQFGLVIFHRGERGRIRPEVPYQAIQLELSLA